MKQTNLPTNHFLRGGKLLVVWGANRGHSPINPTLGFQAPGEEVFGPQKHT